MRLYGSRNKRFEDQCVYEPPNRGYGQVMVWGGITTDHRKALVHIPAVLNGANYVATILQPHVAPFMQSHPTPQPIASWSHKLTSQDNKFGDIHTWP
ncbi:transposable element tcb1 transposase [Plakobranchus ocellatus]|uniref:Transposable element tcb1 transposase n=1 Tax=Plakobranchus ocellatus TaxID=259542 RepID=A0AAV4CJ12_9GAST|nr:transposable element tcb1 transposase [Plakobranchus ocellatus]